MQPQHHPARTIISVIMVSMTNTSEADEAPTTEGKDSVPDYPLPFQQEFFLREIEKNNLDRRLFNPKQLWDNNEDFYGEKGSLLRKSFSNFVNSKIKRHSAQNYVNRLLEKKIPMSETTKSELAKEKSKNNEEVMDVEEAKDEMEAEKADEDDGNGGRICVPALSISKTTLNTLDDLAQSFAAGLKLQIPTDPGTPGSVGSTGGKPSRGTTTPSAAMFPSYASPGHFTPAQAPIQARTPGFAPGAFGTFQPMGSGTAHISSGSSVGSAVSHISMEETRSQHHPNFSRRWPQPIYVDQLGGHQNGSAFIHKEHLSHNHAMYETIVLLVSFPAGDYNK